MSESNENNNNTELSWYVVHAYSGHELKVKEALKKNIEEANLADRFGEIVVPMEDVVEIRGGNKRRSKRKFFPGYVLVQMAMDSNTWQLVCKTSNVLGFIGGTKGNPAPISNQEAENILHRLEASEGKPKPKVLFEPGELVRVIDGPFADFNGAVEEVNYEKNRLRVAVLIFGRSTPVDLDFSQVEKA